MKSVLHKSSKAADSVTVERQPGMAFSANCNLDEYHVSPTMADAHVCHDPRTGVWGRIGDGSQNGLEMSAATKPSLLFSLTGQTALRARPELVVSIRRGTLKPRLRFAGEEQRAACPCRSTIVSHGCDVHVLLDGSVD